MNVAKPRPDDHNILYLFVIGGITFHEVKEIREAVKKLRPSAQVCSPPFNDVIFLWFDGLSTENYLDHLGGRRHSSPLVVLDLSNYDKGA